MKSLMNAYVDEHEDMPNLRLLDRIVITIKNTSEFKGVNVKKKSFVVYISGVDTRGKANKSARIDVIILALVNPSQGKVLLE